MLFRSTTGLLELDTDITEITDPGITALLNASQAKETGDAALTAATTAAASALTVVNNLDLSTLAVTAVEAVGDGMTVVTPADVDAPTTAEIASELAGLRALVTTAAAASVLDISTLDLTDATDVNTLVTDATTALTSLTGYDTDATTTQTAFDAGIATLKTNIEAVAYNTDDATTLAALEVIVDAAETAGFISTADNAAIITAFGDDATVDADFATPATLTAALAAASTAVDTNNQINELDAIVDTLDVANALNTFSDLVDVYDAAAAANPLTLALATAEAAVETAQDDIDDLAEAVADLADATALVTEMTALQTAISDAQTAFTDNDFAAPVTLATGTNYATAADDIFLADDSVATSTIANFNLLGTDTLYIGTDFTFNDGALATDGNNAVLEVFLSEVGGNAVITMESEVFSSNSSDSEVVITLTGVAMADVTIADGFVTVA